MKTDRIDADKAAPDPRFFPASLINGALGAALFCFTASKARISSLPCEMLALASILI